MSGRVDLPRTAAGTGCAARASAAGPDVAPPPPSTLLMTTPRRIPRRARAAAFCALAGLLAVPGAHAGPTNAEMRALFGYRIALACVQQEPAGETSELGRSIAASPGFPGWPALQSRPFPRCLRARRFLDPALCEDMLATVTAKAGESRDASVARIDAALARHEDALRAADDVLYLEDDAQRAPATFACPERVPHHEDRP
jgi:hypothetical protein